MNIRHWLSLSVVIGGMGYGLSARAGAVTLNSGSQFGANADLQVLPVVTPAIMTVSAQNVPVTSLPFTGTASATGISGDTSTTGAVLSTEAFKFTFNQNVSSLDGDTDGYGTMFFTANSNVSYSISALLNFEASDSPQSAEMFVQLFDQTQDQMLYTYDNFLFGPGSMTADGEGLTGTLIAGHSYEFYIDENMTAFTDPTIVGNGSITFGSVVTPPGGGSTVPLPSGMGGGLIFLGMAAGALVLRSRHTAQTASV